MKKTLAIVLAIFMIVSTIPMAFATETNVITDEAGLRTAFETGGEYTLGNDIIITDAVSHLNDVTTVIDLGTYTIGADAAWNLCVDAGDVTFIGGKLNRLVPTTCGGTFKLIDTVYTGLGNGINNHGGTLILENVTVNVEDENCIYSTAGTTYIIGGSYTCGEDTEIISYYDTIPDVKIYGGTFSKSVAEYVADGYSEVEKDGKYVVESNMKGTAGEGITWIIDYYGTLTISGTGAIVVDWYAPPWLEYNDLIKNIVVEEGITEVPDSAFAYAENLVTGKRFFAPPGNKRDI